VTNTPHKNGLGARDPAQIGYQCYDGGGGGGGGGGGRFIGGRSQTTFREEETASHAKKAS